MTFSPEGKSAIVTGAGGGINLAFAKKLLEAGANVLIADLVLTPEAEKVVEQYSNKPKAVFLKTDVTSWPDLDQMFKVAQETFGPIDVVCPGAGIFEPPWSNFWYPPGSTTSKDDPSSGRYKSIDINLTHPIRVTQMAISHFLAGSPKSSATNPKRIVLIASVAGELAFLPFPLYNVSKFGIVAMIHSLGPLEEHFGIRVGGVVPGAVKTRIWTEHEDKMIMATDKETGEVQSSWLTPEEVASAMMAIVQNDEVDGKEEKITVGGGTILEVTGGPLRSVPMLGNMGPDLASPGMVVANMPSAFENVIGELHKPGWGQC